MGAFKDDDAAFSSPPFFYEKEEKSTLTSRSLSRRPFHPRYHSASIPLREHNVELRRAGYSRHSGGRSSGGKPLFSFRKSSSAMSYAKMEENRTFLRNKDGSDLRNRNELCSSVSTSSCHTVIPNFSSGVRASVPHYSRGQSESLFPFSSSFHAPSISAGHRVWQRFSSTEKDHLSSSSTVITNCRERNEKKWREEENQNNIDSTTVGGVERERMKWGETPHGENGMEGKETVYGFGGVHATIRNFIKPTFQYSGSVSVPSPPTRSANANGEPWRPPQPPFCLSSAVMKSTVERSPPLSRVLPSECHTLFSSSSTSPIVSLPSSSPPHTLPSHGHHPLLDAPVVFPNPSLLVCPAQTVEKENKRGAAAEEGKRRRTRSHEGSLHTSNGPRDVRGAHSYRSPSACHFMSPTTSQYGDEGGEGEMPCTAWNGDDTPLRIGKEKEMEAVDQKYLLSPRLSSSSARELPRRPPPPPPAAFPSMSYAPAAAVSDVLVSPDKTAASYTHPTRRRQTQRGREEEVIRPVREGHEKAMRRHAYTREVGGTITRKRRGGARRRTSSAIVLLPPRPSPSFSSSPCSSSSSSSTLSSFPCTSSSSFHEEENEGKQNKKESSFSSSSSSSSSSILAAEHTKTNHVVSVVSEWLRQERRRRRRAKPLVEGEGQSGKRSHGMAVHHGSHEALQERKRAIRQFEEKKHTEGAPHVGEKEVYPTGKEERDGSGRWASTEERENGKGAARKEKEHPHRRHRGVESVEKKRRIGGLNRCDIQKMDDAALLSLVASKREKKKGKAEKEENAVQVITIKEGKTEEKEEEKREKNKKQHTDDERKARDEERTCPSLHISPSFDNLSFSSSTSHTRVLSGRSGSSGTSMSSSPISDTRHQPHKKGRKPSKRDTSPKRILSSPSSEPKLLLHTLKLTQVPGGILRLSHSSSFSTFSTPVVQETSENDVDSSSPTSLLYAYGAASGEKVDAGGSGTLLPLSSPSSSRPPPLSIHQLSQPLPSNAAKPTLPATAMSSPTLERRAVHLPFGHTPSQDGTVDHPARNDVPQDDAAREKEKEIDPARPHVERENGGSSATLYRRMSHTMDSHGHPTPHDFLFIPTSATSSSSSTSPAFFMASAAPPPLSSSSSSSLYPRPSDDGFSFMQSTSSPPPSQRLPAILPRVGTPSGASLHRQRQFSCGNAGEEDERERRRLSLSSLGGIEPLRRSCSIVSTSGCNPVIFSPVRPSWNDMLPEDKRKIREKLRQGAFGRPPSNVLLEMNHRRSSLSFSSSPRHSISTATKREKTKEKEKGQAGGVAEMERHDSIPRQMTTTSVEDYRRATAASSRRGSSGVWDGSRPAASTGTPMDGKGKDEANPAEGGERDTTVRRPAGSSSPFPEAAPTASGRTDVSKTTTTDDPNFLNVPLSPSSTAGERASRPTREEGIGPAREDNAGCFSPSFVERGEGLGGGARGFAASTTTTNSSSSPFHDAEAGRKRRSTGRQPSAMDTTASSLSPAARHSLTSRTSSTTSHQGMRLSRLQKKFPLPPGALQEYRRERQRWDTEEQKAHEWLAKKKQHPSGTEEQEGEEEEGRGEPKELRKGGWNSSCASSLLPPSHVSDALRPVSSASPRSESAFQVDRTGDTAIREAGSGMPFSRSAGEDAPPAEGEQRHWGSTPAPQRQEKETGDERGEGEELPRKERRRVRGGGGTAGLPPSRFHSHSHHHHHHHHSHHPHPFPRSQDASGAKPPPVPLVHVSTTYDLPTSLRILMLGDHFFLLSHPFMPGRSFFAGRFSYEPRTIANPRFVWVDSKSYLLVWGKPGEWEDAAPAYRRTLFRKSIRLEKISHIGCSSFTRLPDGTNAGDRRPHYPISPQQYQRAHFAPSHLPEKSHAGTPYHHQSPLLRPSSDAGSGGRKWGDSAALPFHREDEERSPRQTGGMRPRPSLERAYGSPAVPWKGKSGSASDAKPGDPSWLEPVGTTYYVLSIQTPKKCIQLSTVSQRKADTWYDALHNVCEFVRRTSLSRRAEIPD